MANIGTFFYTLLDEPLVFVIASGWNFLSGMALCRQTARGRPCRVLVQCAWYVPHIYAEIDAFRAKVDPSFRNVILTYLCPNQSDAEFLMRRGIDALHVHHNAFIDERKFAIVVGVEKKYRAVHTASLMQFKRHELAWGVQKIAIITYDPNGENTAQQLSGYQNLAYLNVDNAGKIEHLPAEQVGAIVNESHCGLILSEIEGANYASTEYLLCGIPLVSTPSLGGREEFYDTRHVKIVEPTAQNVERAVEEWCHHAPPPEQIRESVLNKCRVHRGRLLHWLCAVSGRDVFQTAGDNLWSSLFIDKLRTWVKLSQDL